MGSPGTIDRESPAARALFWLSAAGTGWVLVGYPLALAALPARPWRTADRAPVVSIVVPAYRERDALATKLRSLERLDYPPELLELIVVVDEDERTAEAARAARPDAEVRFSTERRGKLAALLEGAAAARGDVLLLTDADNAVSPEAITALVRHFEDPSIGGVTGDRTQGDSYERYEARIRTLEARSGSVAGAAGELFAVRAEAFPEAPASPERIVNDDFWLLCRLVESGWRVVFEPAARSVESPHSTSGEMERRARMMAGLVASAPELARVPPAFAVRLASHKYGRVLLPAFLIGLLGACVRLRRRRRYRALLVSQAVFYALGGLGVAAGPSAAGAVPGGRAARQFLLGNLATLRGISRALLGGQSARWSSPREG